MLGGDGTTASPNQYVNSTNPVQTFGAEAEVRRDWRNGVTFSASSTRSSTRPTRTTTIGLLGWCPLNTCSSLDQLSAAATKTCHVQILTCHTALNTLL